MENFKQLSRTEMKNIVAGKVWCSVTTASGCGGGFGFYSCSGDANTCQDAADDACWKNDCCDDVNCE